MLNEHNTLASFQRSAHSFSSGGVPSNVRGPELHLVQTSQVSMEAEQQQQQSHQHQQQPETAPRSAAATVTLPPGPSPSGSRFFVPHELPFPPPASAALLATEEEEDQAGAHATACTPSLRELHRLATAELETRRERWSEMKKAASGPWATPHLATPGTTSTTPVNGSTTGYRRAHHQAGQQLVGSAGRRHLPRAVGTPARFLRSLRPRTRPGPAVATHDPPHYLLSSVAVQIGRAEAEGVEEQVGRMVSASALQALHRLVEAEITSMHIMSWDAGRSSTSQSLDQLGMMEYMLRTRLKMVREAEERPGGVAGLAPGLGFLPWDTREAIARKLVSRLKALRLGQRAGAGAGTGAAGARL